MAWSCRRCRALDLSDLFRSDGRRLRSVPDASRVPKAVAARTVLLLRDGAEHAGGLWTAGRDRLLEDGRRILPVRLRLQPYKQRSFRVVPACCNLVGPGGQLSAMGLLDRYHRLPGLCESRQVRSARNAVLCHGPDVPRLHPHHAEPLPGDAPADGRGDGAPSRPVPISDRRPGPQPFASKLLDDHPSADDFLRIRLARRAILLRACRPDLEGL